MSDDIFSALRADNDTTPGLPNIEKIFEHFFIQPDQLVEREAITHVYHCISQKPTYNIDTPEERPQAIFDEIIDKIQFRLDIFNTYEEDFFEGMPNYDRPALVMAVICDDLLHEPFKTMSADTPSCLISAKYIWQQARDHEEYGLEDDASPSPVSRILGIINAMEVLEDIKTNLKDNSKHFPVTDLEKMIKDVFPIMGSLIEGNSDIENELMRTLDEVETEMLRRRGPGKLVQLSHAPQPGL